MDCYSYFEVKQPSTVGIVVYFAAALVGFITNRACTSSGWTCLPWMALYCYLAVCLVP